MEYRNARYSSADKSTIDMEINHPVYGWIPFTASASDTTDYGPQLFEAANGHPATAAYQPAN